MSKQVLLSIGLLSVVGLLVLAGCAQEGETAAAPEPVVVQAFAIDETAVAADTVHMVGFVPDASADGNGSFMVAAEEPVTVTLFELGDIDIENQTLLYRAKVKTEDVDGQVYIEMVCVFEDGEYFSRALDSLVSGSVDWTEQETPFFLKEGENPMNVKLNLVISGTGTAWIDDITVLKEPLPAEA
jgi:hypothetical protein